jgi:hypothetical protein
MSLNNPKNPPSHKASNGRRILFGLLALILCGVIVYYVPSIVSSRVEYSSQLKTGNKIDDKKIINKKIEPEVEVVVPPVVIPVTHLKTPKVVKALYMSSWVAGSEKFRDSLVKIIDETELNAVVIDIKDSTGRISFELPNEEIQKLGSAEKRISNIRWLTNLLHDKGIYIIGRISVFQDPYLTKVKPEWAITKKSDGTIWKDRKGLSFLDPAKTEVHKYILAVALGSYEEGFDEINFDYIRYPSDGNISDINYRLAEGQTRADNIENFFKFLSTEIKKEKNIPISADLFGLTTEGTDDMGIGQVWEKALPYFDYLAPMVYPSHYASGYAGYKNPGQYPYEVVYRAISKAIEKTKLAGGDVNKIRPWLQDFDLGAVYTKEMVQAQIKAVNDLGLSSWMLWDPSNKYTPEALKLENNQ